MRWIDDAWSRTALPSPVVATIGNFDGVHRGQRSIIDAAVSRGQELDLPAVVITFDPHPLRVVAPERAPRRLISATQKRGLLAATGIDCVLEIHFDEQFSHQSAEAFVRSFLVERLAVRELFVGSRFAFGRGQEGDLRLLEELGEALGFVAHGIAETTSQDEPVSSSRIRRAVAEGDVRSAAQMLGRPFSVQGTIVHGERRGRGLGWPTINLMPDAEQVIPDKGVYVTSAQLGGGTERLPAVTNVGVRPTLSPGTELVVETHILDFSADVYGEEAEVAFLERVRAERAFESVEALSQQIQFDVEHARNYFATRIENGRS